MRGTTEYEVRLHKTSVRPSTRYDNFRKILKYKYTVRVKTELVPIIVLVQGRTGTRSY